MRSTPCETTAGGRSYAAATGTALQTNGTSRGYLDLLGLTIITADGGTATCKHSHGSSLLDYIICDVDVACLIGNVELDSVTPWAPHSALKFTVNRRPKHITIQQLLKPKPLPYQVDNKNANLCWNISACEWQDSYSSFYDKASDQFVRDSDPHGVWAHADSLGITEVSRQRAVRYAQWSMAVEAAIISQSDTPCGDSHLGRGQLPILEEKSLANKSSNLKIEHFIWTFPPMKQWRAPTYFRPFGPLFHHFSMLLALLLESTLLTLLHKMSKLLDGSAFISPFATLP